MANKFTSEQFTIGFLMLSEQAEARDQYTPLDDPHRYDLAEAQWQKLIAASGWDEHDLKRWQVERYGRVIAGIREIAEGGRDE